MYRQEDGEDAAPAVGRSPFEDMKRFCIATSIIMLLVIGGATFLYFYLGIPESKAIMLRFYKIVETGDHQSVLNSAIRMIDSTKTNVTYMDNYDYPSLTNLPAPIRSLDPRSVGVSPDHMVIELHGGFAHYGFRILKTENNWSMNWYNEEETEELLSIPRARN